MRVHSSYRHIQSWIDLLHNFNWALALSTVWPIQDGGRQVKVSESGGLPILPEEVPRRDRADWWESCYGLLDEEIWDGARNPTCSRGRNADR
jgi:hypothetical protein